MNTLKHLSFMHIEGFQQLKEEEKDLFIQLHKKHIKNLRESKRHIYAETHIEELKKIAEGCFLLAFDNGAKLYYEKK